MQNFIKIYHAVKEFRPFSLIDLYRPLTWASLIIGKGSRRFAYQWPDKIKMFKQNLIKIYEGDPRSNANTSITYFVMNLDQALKFDQLISVYVCTVYV